MKKKEHLKALFIGLAVIAYFSACIAALLPFGEESGSGYLHNFIYRIIGRLGIVIAAVASITVFLFVALWSIGREDEKIDSTKVCAFCSKPLSTSVGPHLIKEHRVCSECYEKIEEEKSQEES